MSPSVVKRIQIHLHVRAIAILHPEFSNRRASLAEFGFTSSRLFYSFVSD